MLLNNMAWLLRRMPVFAVGGEGGYRIRGIHVEDLAAPWPLLATGLLLLLTGPVLFELRHRVTRRPTGSP